MRLWSGDGRDAIDPSLRIRSVALAVSDLERSADFYERVLGLAPLVREPDMALLGVPGSEPSLELRRLQASAPAPAHASGLYHVAWLHPSRAALADTVRRVAGARWPFQGASDHGVSEALYLADPDGLGIEIYADRPRERWQHGADGRGVAMVSEPLDLDDLLAQSPRGEPAAAVAPGTGVGHVHLKVSDVTRTAAFYRDALGFEQTAALPSAAFLAAGGYHHHVGLNSWESRGAGPAPDGAPGLREVLFELSDTDQLEALTRRLEPAAGAPEHELRRATDGAVTLRDPDGQRLRFLER